MSTDDERVSHALHDLAYRDATTGPVPVADLLRRGRRARRLRTFTGTASAAGAVALTCAATLVLIPGGTTGAPTPPAARSTSAPPPTATAAPTTGSPGDALDLLRGKLPTTLRLSKPWRSSPEPRGLPGIRQGVAYTATDGLHTGTVGIQLGRATPRTNEPCPIANCTVTARPDGSQLTVYLPTRAAGGEQDWRAELRRPDGTYVIASAGNIPGQGDDRREPYPNPPLLDGPQLTALALDPVWQQVALSLPAQ